MKSLTTNNKNKMEDYMKPSSLYEYTINHFSEYPLMVQDHLHKHLPSLDWVRDFLENLNVFQRELFKQSVLINIDNPEVSFDLMSISAIIYNLNLLGVDVTELENKVNSSERVYQEVIKAFNNGDIEM